jgi:hypothetical protein
MRYTKSLFAFSERRVGFIHVPLYNVASEASENNCSIDGVTLVGWCDFNVPLAKGKDNCKTLCNGVCCINDSDAMKSCCIISLPDIPKASSMRGLWDEETQISSALFANKQHHDTRWVELYSRPKNSASKATGRKFGMGRIAVNYDHMSTNPWLEASELAVNGRPCSSDDGLSPPPVAQLPKGQNLLVPVSDSPDGDIMTADRYRPSPEQVAAQKGVKRNEIIIQSLFTNMEIAGPVLLVNLTGYVEDVGVAAFALISLMRHRRGKSVLCNLANTSNTY